MLKLKDLLYFSKLSEIKNITETASFFNVRQPTISYAIKRLEEELNEPLIFRNYNHHTIYLTKAGHILNVYANSINNEIDNIYKEVENLNQQNIICGIPPIIGNQYFTSISIDLIKKGIMDEIKILNSGSEDLLLNIQENEIDIGIIGSLNMLENPNLRIKLVKKESFSIISSYDHFTKNKDSISFKELKNETFITLDEHYIHSEALNQLCRNYNFNPNVVYQNGDINILKQMVKNNMGIAILANTAINKNDQFQVTPIKDTNQPYFYILLVYQIKKEKILKEKDIISTFENQLF